MHRWFIAMLLPAALTLLDGCEDRGASSGPDLAIVVSGDTTGWIAPCGCASNQSGGMARRGTYVRGLGDGSSVIYLDCGGAAGGTGEYHRMKLESILDGERLLGVAAHNLGGPELALGPETLSAVMKATSVPFVSANTTREGGRRLADPYRVVERGGRRVAVIGVVSPAFATASIRVSDPRQAVLDALATIGDFDLLVVLAYCPQEELEALAAALPEADAIVGGPAGQAIAPREAGATVLAAATNKGKFVVELRLGENGRPSAARSRIVEIDAGLADDAGQVENIERYLARLADRDMTASESRLAPALPADLPGGWSVAGTDACRSCHEHDHRVWAGSKHAHAWRTLVERGHHVDSYCQQCHVVGFGLPDGFVSAGSASESHVDVGCESCHGPSAAHVRDPAQRTPWNAFDQCLSCHDQENSPAFDRDAYWARIVHGAWNDPGAAGP